MPIVPSKQTEVKRMPSTLNVSRAKREANLQDAKRALARAIEQDQPTSVVRHLREKVQVIEWLLSEGLEG